MNGTRNITVSAKVTEIMAKLIDLQGYSRSNTINLAIEEYILYHGRDKDSRLEILAARLGDIEKENKVLQAKIDNNKVYASQIEAEMEKIKNAPDKEPSAIEEMDWIIQRFNIQKANNFEAAYNSEAFMRLYAAVIKSHDIPRQQVFKFVQELYKQEGRD